MEMATEAEVQRILDEYDFSDRKRREIEATARLLAVHLAPALGKGDAYWDTDYKGDAFWLTVRDRVLELIAIHGAVSRQEICEDPWMQRNTNLAVHPRDWFRALRQRLIPGKKPKATDERKIMEFRVKQHANAIVWATTEDFFHCGVRAAREREGLDGRIPPWFIKNYRGLGLGPKSCRRCNPILGGSSVRRSAHPPQELTPEEGRILSAQLSHGKE